MLIQIQSQLREKRDAPKSSLSSSTALSLIEPAIMIFMGIFVAFVLISLYLPIFSLADSIRS